MQKKSFLLAILLQDIEQQRRHSRGLQDRTVTRRDRRHEERPHFLRSERHENPGAKARLYYRLFRGPEGPRFHRFGCRRSCRRCAPAPASFRPSPFCDVPDAGTFTTSARRKRGIDRTSLSLNSPRSTWPDPFDQNIQRPEEGRDADWGEAEGGQEAVDVLAADGTGAAMPHAVIRRVDQQQQPDHSRAKGQIAQDRSFLFWPGWLHRQLEFTARCALGRRMPGWKDPALRLNPGGAASQ